MCVSVRLSALSRLIGPMDVKFGMGINLDPSWQKDFGAKELYIMGRERCVKAQAFSYLNEIALI